jgi:hypothetical protein
MRVEYNIDKVQDMPYPLFLCELRYVSSPVIPGLTSPELFVAEYCRLFEYFRSSLRLLLKLHLEVLLCVLPWLYRSYEVLMPRITFLIWYAMENRTPYGVAPEP